MIQDMQNVSYNILDLNHVVSLFCAVKEKSIRYSICKLFDLFVNYAHIKNTINKKPTVWYNTKNEHHK